MKRKNGEKKSIFKYQGSECPICIEEMTIESRSVTSPCMHEFCLVCIGKWLTGSSSTLCPLCKQSVYHIIYNIRTPTKYAMINFSKGFNCAWVLRNKIKNILDNFENIIFKIYSTVVTFLTNNKGEFDPNILNYLVYFGNLSCRLKSSSTSTYPSKKVISGNEECWPLVEQLVRQRLSLMFTNSFFATIFNNHIGKSISYTKLLTILKRHLDPVRFNCLKLDINLSLQMLHDPSAYLEYYVPGDHEHIIYTKSELMDKNTAAALITRVIASINIENLDFTIAGYQITNIDYIFCILDYFCSFQNLITHLAFSSHYILLSTEFYSSINLKKPMASMNTIPKSTCTLIKHCFKDEELDHINQTLMEFEKRLIYFEPLLIDDSSDSSQLVEGEEEPEIEEEEDYYSCPQSDIVIELSDSDEDALEIIYVNHPVFDLTESFSEDDVILEETPNKKRKISFSSEEEIDDKIDLQKILGLCSSDSQPTTSFQSEQYVVNSLDSASPSVTSPVRIVECLSDDEEINIEGINFIYQPRSDNDFYNYLMPPDLPDS